MSSFSKRLAWGLLVGAVALAGCGSNAETEAAVNAQGGFSQEPAEVAHAGLMREALSKVALRPDQRPLVDQLAAEASVRHQSIKQARQALRYALADQVQAGKVDRAALKPQIDALLAAIEQSRAADRAALLRLHDILDKSQRNQFVDAVDAAFQARRNEHGGHHGMRRWAAELNLTDQQRDQIRSALHDKFQGQHQAMKEQGKAMHEQRRQLLESFREDQFTLDANAQVFGRDKIERGIDRMLDLAGAAVPILTAEQRAVAAQKIRTHVGGRL
jgi:Spy/CpxP family protein refolding chaperone